MNIVRTVFGTAPSPQASRVVSICDTAEAAAFFARSFECEATERNGLTLMLTGSAALGAWYLTLEREAQPGWDPLGDLAKTLAYRLRFEAIQQPITLVCLGTQDLSPHTSQRTPDVLRSCLREALRRANMAYPPQDLLLRPVLRSDELPDHYLHAPRGYLGPNELDAKDPINYLVNLSANTSLFSRTDQAFAKRLLFQDPHHTTPTGRLEGIHFHAATGSVIALDLLKNLHARYAENEAHRSAFRPYVLDSQRANNSHQARLAVAVLEVFMLLALARNRRVRATFALNLDTFAFMQGKLSLTSTGAAAEWMVALTEAECELLATHATRWLFSEEQFRHIQGQQYQAGEYADSTMHTIARLLYQQCREISRAVLNALTPTCQALPTQHDVDNLHQGRPSRGGSPSRSSIEKRPR